MTLLTIDRDWITRSEACKKWGQHRNTLTYDYWNSRLVMTKSEGTWLVYVPSMIALYGAPKVPIDPVQIYLYTP